MWNIIGAVGLVVVLATKLPVEVDMASQESTTKDVKMLQLQYRTSQDSKKTGFFQDVTILRIMPSECISLKILKW